MEDPPRKILLIGGHNTGKTVYGTQLLGRLRSGSSSLSLRYPPPNLSVFEEALDQLNEGRAPDHTPLDTYEKLLLPVATPGGNNVDIEWPDYGGEQINRILEDRHVPPDWQQRITESDGWLLFIRLSLLRDYENVISRHLGGLVRAREKADDSEVEWSDQAKLTELLQMFLFFRGVNALQQVRSPVLMIVLSCWDELELQNKVCPPDLLQERLPLLHSFVSARWSEESWSVKGLSAQGRTLSKNDPSSEYVKKGPTNFGFIVDSEGNRFADLSRPIVELIDQM
jgi:hypothetical protein